MTLTYWNRYKVCCVWAVVMWSVLWCNPLWQLSDSVSLWLLYRKLPSADSSPWKSPWPLSTRLLWPQIWGPSPTIVQILSSMGKFTWGTIGFCFLSYGLGCSGMFDNMENRQGSWGGGENGESELKKEKGSFKTQFEDLVTWHGGHLSVISTWGWTLRSHRTVLFGNYL